MLLRRENLSSAWAFLARLRERVSRQAPWLFFALFALAVCWQYTTPTPVRVPTAKPEPDGDGTYYYAYLRSIAFDHDVELTNDYRLLGDQFGAGIHPETKRARNVFSVGPAVFWLPFVPVAHAGQALAEALGAPHDELDGTESLFQRSVLFGSVWAGLVTCALGILLARRITTPALASLAAVGLCIGSPLIWYMLRQPAFSHAIDSCVAAQFALAWMASYGSRSYLRWLGLGVLLGFAMLVRPQNVTHVLLPLCEWLLLNLPRLRAGRRHELPRAFGNGALFVITVVVVFSPLLVIWRLMYGDWVLVPQGADFMDWTSSRWDATLFSTRNGLFSYHPLLLISALGLVALASLRRFPRELRVLAGASLLVLGLQAYINGSAYDWWGGWAFGGRRFLSCSLYFIAGLATVLELAREFVTRHTRGVVHFASACGLLGFAFYNWSLSEDLVTGAMPPDAVQSMKPRYGSALAKFVELVYPYTGNPGSFPPNLLFAARARTSPQFYDTASGDDMLPPELATGRGFGFDDYHAFGGFGPTAELNGRPARKVEGTRAYWGFVLRKRMKLTGEIIMMSSHPRARVQMFVGGHKVLDARPTQEWKPYPMKVPLDDTSTGMNYVKVVQRLREPGQFVAYGGAGLAGIKEPGQDAITAPRAR